MTLSVFRTFDSYEEFNSFPHGWDADFRVTTNEAYVATLEHAELQGALVNTASFSQSTLQQASTPEGMRSIALPLRIDGPMTWFNHELDEHSLILFPENRELFSVSSACMHMATFSIKNEFFERQLEQVEIADHVAIRDGQVRQLDPATWRHLHKCLDTIADYCKKYPGDQGSPELESYLAEEAAYQLFSLALGRPQDSYGLPLSAAAKHARTAMQYIMPRLRTPLTVAEVCSATGIGRRNMEMSFRRYLGLSPKQVIKQMRYAFCREDLLTQRWSTVGDTASAWGFWHMGQFAADYKALFGESPKETLTAKG